MGNDWKYKDQEGILQKSGFFPGQVYSLWHDEEFVDLEEHWILATALSERQEVWAS